MINNEENEEIFESKDQLINEEYKIWKYNSKYLYNKLFVTSLEWPSLTVSYLGDNKGSDSNLLFGTFAPVNEYNYIMTGRVRFPEVETIGEDKVNNIYTYEYNKDTLNRYRELENKFEITQKISFQGEVNRAKPMPQDQNIIASKCINGEVQIYELNKHLEENELENYLAQPELILNGHNKEGFGLDWNLGKKGYIISGSEDNKICVWDINKGKVDESKGGLNPLFKPPDTHQAPVNDVCFHRLQFNIFASCSDDRQIRLWDMRMEAPMFKIEGHVQEINSVDFNHFNEYLLLSGSNDKSVALWDMRNIKDKLYQFKNHKNDVLQVKWSPHILSLFASSSRDRRINVWDLSKISSVPQQRTSKTSKNSFVSPPELIFTHSGHTSSVNFFDWNPEKELEIASVSEDNILQVWKMNEKIYYEEEDEMEIE